MNNQEPNHQYEHVYGYTASPARLGQNAAEITTLTAFPLHSAPDYASAGSYDLYRSYPQTYYHHAGGGTYATVGGATHVVDGLPASSSGATVTLVAAPNGAGGTQFYSADLGSVAAAGGGTFRTEYLTTTSGAGIGDQVLPIKLKVKAEKELAVAQDGSGCSGHVDVHEHHSPADSNILSSLSEHETTGESLPQATTSGAAGSDPSSRWTAGKRRRCANAVGSKK
ncbi:hypothetical protein M3Y99_01910500 [Aphelenchoides fujianensis]|nr:hypothetical protein M3Y99_01910500 [Aphelenchoides fujianensis]